MPGYIASISVLVFVTAVAEKFGFGPCLSSVDVVNRYCLTVQKFEWFRVDHLPSHKKDTACKHLGLTPNSFFMVIPFVKYVLINDFMTVSTCTL